MRQLTIISLLFIITNLFNIGCSESLTPPINDESINIEFPIGKKAVYAIANCIGDIDSLELEFVQIFSLEFDSVVSKFDRVEYVGKIENLNKSFLSEDSNKVYRDFSPEKIIVSIDDKWVLFQHSENYNSSMIFMKRASIETDTTSFPSHNLSQFPIFPKKITKNTFYSIYRPGDDSLYIGVQRNFDVKNSIDWNDIYGTDKGLYYTTEHNIKFDDDLIFNFKGIIDARGIVTSIIRFDDMVRSTINNPMGGDTITVHQINRRIVDFTEPENIKELSWYADLVRENGLVPLNIE